MRINFLRKDSYVLHITNFFWKIQKLFPFAKNGWKIWSYVYPPWNLSSTVLHLCQQQQLKPDKYKYIYQMHITSLIWNPWFGSKSGESTWQTEHIIYWVGVGVAPLKERIFCPWIRNFQYFGMNGEVKNTISQKLSLFMKMAKKTWKCIPFIMKFC